MTAISEPLFAYAEPPRAQNSLSDGQFDESDKFDAAPVNF
jgi:hypothetical protein